MATETYDDSNWREEYKNYTSNKRYLELLENGPKSLSQAWLLGALHNEWKKIKKKKVKSKLYLSGLKITSFTTYYTLLLHFL